jgi:hypothetical protein
MNVEGGTKFGKSIVYSLDNFQYLYTYLSDEDHIHIEWSNECSMKFHQLEYFERKEKKKEMNYMILEHAPTGFHQIIR